MGTITERKRKNGSRSYTAQIRIKRDGVIAHTEAQTFDRKQAAQAWLKKREAELSAPDALTTQANRVTLGNAIDRYIEENEKAIGRTKSQVLNKIKEYHIASMLCQQIRSEDIVDFARELRSGCKPQTVLNYISHLSAIFTLARPAWGVPLDRQAMLDAQIVLKRLGTTSRSRERDRRPTLDELDHLLTYYETQHTMRRSEMPMQLLILFALFSTRRQEEITRLQWADLDTLNKRILVRDMKNPGEKLGNHTWCDLPDPCLGIITAMPQTDQFIFPYNSKSISASFTRACPLLGIADLHFHDLRHEGVSRLFEMGWNIPHVAAVSGHRSWNSLKRYSHIRQSGDRFKDWKWIEAYIAEAS